MFSFLRRRIPAAQPTFNERVDSFWRWFREVGPRFHQTIEAGQCSSLAEETSAKVDALLPGLAWVYGPGAEGMGHSLTLSGEGNPHRQLLALHWLTHAPKLEGWTFYAARQPGKITGSSLEIQGISFHAREIWVSPSIDKENERIDITVWHPAWERIEPKQRSMVTFLFLDEALGEYGTDGWIGQLDFDQSKLAKSFSLGELADYVDQTTRSHQWTPRTPGKIWTLFTTKNSPGNFPRADIMTQSTCVPKLFTDYMQQNGDLEDPLEGFGADYVYVSIDATHFPPGKEVSRRGAIEEALEQELTATSQGRCIGGALGRERSYIDVLIFDGERSLDAVKRVLVAQGVASGAMIEYFAREKKGQPIAL